MNTNKWQSEETPPHDKHLEEFQGDEVKGNEISGGGKGSVIIPTADGTLDSSTEDSSETFDDGTII